MRLGIVRGHVTLSPAVPELMGKTLVVLEPVTMTNLVAKNGQMVAFTEGREAANPFWPNSIPVDAYCTLIVDSITTGNAKFEEAEVSK
jgi:microcompartment protein CcmK/EutM